MSSEIEKICINCDYCKFTKDFNNNNPITVCVHPDNRKPLKEQGLPQAYMYVNAFITGCNNFLTHRLKYNISCKNISL